MPTYKAPSLDSLEKHPMTEPGRPPEEESSRCGLLPWRRPLFLSLKFRFPFTVG